ncbi:probable nucleolar protein 5-1 [Miscanthus floridulus]|uniref:probable nucleolar protein 5-1 n=1 Tax=Miscanthus floridulus TaxID=154761 RepID=UPI00345991C2
MLAMFRMFQKKIKVLFETPSGFAFFGFNGGYVNVENLLEIIWTYLTDSTTVELAIWPLEFEKFENKSDAIGTSGIDDRITKMIKNWYCSGETILVGKSEHKLAIETELKIACRCDEVAFEVMWGLENHLHILVPDEELELREEGP